MQPGSPGTPAAGTDREPECASKSQSSSLGDRRRYQNAVLTTALFLGLALVLALSSLLMILHRHPVPCALFMVVALCALAGIYVMLGAEFLGMVQLVVYAGAIMVLFLFVIMFVAQDRSWDVGANVGARSRAALGWVGGTLLLIEGLALVGRRLWLGPVSPEGSGHPAGNAEAVGRLLYSRYLYPFEIASVLLLVAIVGVIVLAGRRRPHDEKGDAQDR